MFFAIICVTCKKVKLTRNKYIFTCIHTEQTYMQGNNTYTRINTDQRHICTHTHTYTGIYHTRANPQENHITSRARQIETRTW